MRRKAVRYHQVHSLLALGMAFALAAAAVPGPTAADWEAAVKAAREGGGSVLPAEDAAGAVDGVTSGGFAFHTGQDESPWWQVDLGTTHELDRVVIFGSHCSERLNGFEIRLSDEGHNWRTAYVRKEKTDGEGTFTVPLRGQDGRYLRVWVPGTTWMHLAEVQVFGVAEPQKNLALKQPALQSSVSQWSTRSVRLEAPSGEWNTDVATALNVVTRAARGAGPQAAALQREADALAKAGTRPDDPAWVQLYARASAESARWLDVRTQFPLINLEALARAIAYLAATFPESIHQAEAWQARLAAFRVDLEQVRSGLREGQAESWQRAAALLAFQREVLLANPLLDFERLLLVRRLAGNLGLPANWQSNCALARTGYGNDIATLAMKRPEDELTRVYKPEADVFVGDLDLHPDAGRLMFSMSDPQKPWQVYEATLERESGSLRSAPRQVTADMGADVNNYDACYVPDGTVIYSSTAPMVAVPCVNGSTHVANLFRLSADGTSSRQLCFDQEHAWCPTLLNNGRILYLRWEYADLPHSNSRILFSMNPDGTGQMAYYGSNSYWPNGTFYARPIPGHPTQVVGVISGHHGVPRMGELILFDPAKGRHEADGVVQRIPGYGQPVEPVVRDTLVDASWPKFLHPFPLGRADGKGSGTTFLTAMQPAAGALWGIYLVDTFDNLLLLKQVPGYALLEPIPLRSVQEAPVIPDKVDLQRQDGLVYLADIYRGPGLAGVPKGEVKALRLYSYTYGYRGMGGLYGTIGIDGPWDVRRVLGTVAVHEDGSAFFRVPANVPVAVQPLDRDGKALQIMRSWFTAMPGETISCVGCHETQNESPPAKATLASRQPPTDAVAWYGKARGFAFEREVQPTLDRHCIQCHNGTTTAAGKPLFSLRSEPLPRKWVSKMSGHAGGWGGKFSLGYVNLHRYVRHPGIESDMHMAAPMDFHADTTELVQLLRQGHYGVILAKQDWDRLVTWIDMNTPYHGDWATIAGDDACAAEKRRAEMRRQYANVDEYDIEPPAEPGPAGVPLPNVPSPVAGSVPELAGWPWSPGAAAARQQRPAEDVPVAEGLAMGFVYIPAGEFVMGAAAGCEDEQPMAVVRIDHGFWMSQTEVTNQQFARFDPTHDSRREHKQGYQFGVKGYPLNAPDQPVARVSWQQAQAFCRWLAAATGLDVALPTEAQWEYACRAGSATPLFFGDLGADFSAWANVADEKTREFASDPYTLDVPIKDPPEFDDWLPKDAAYNDGGLVSTPVGHYRPNPWGLRDMHGNVAEWTRSLYLPYPYTDADGRNALGGEGDRVVRGGSWRDRVKRCTAAYRLPYRPYQQVYNVGFRVIVDADLPTLGAAAKQTRREAPAGPTASGKAVATATGN